MQGSGDLHLSLTVCKKVLTVRLRLKDYMKLYSGETLLEKMNIYEALFVKRVVKSVELVSGA